MSVVEAGGETLSDGDGEIDFAEQCLKNTNALPGAERDVDMKCS